MIPALLATATTAVALWLTFRLLEARPAWWVPYHIACAGGWNEDRLDGCATRRWKGLPQQPWNGRN